MSKTIGVGTVTLTDLTDAIVANTEPDIKEVGTLWIDSTGGNNILKEWNGSRWVTVTLDVSSLDPDLAEKVTSMERKLGNIGTDGELDHADRVLLAEELSLIIGETLSTSATLYYTGSLPDYTVVDSEGRGTFATARRNAQQAGVDEDSSVYVDLQHAYTEMINYMDNFSPRPWDIRESQSGNLTDLGENGDRLREVLLEYYLAELALVTTTTEVANEKLAKDIMDSDASGGSALHSTRLPQPVQIPELSNNSRNAFTLEVLVYALADGPYTILQRENGNPVLSLTETSDGLGVTWGTTTFSNPDAIPYGAWSRISLTTNDVGGGNFSLYVDGNFISGITISLPTNLNNLYISPDFGGYISDLRLWDVGMSDTEIHEVANHSLEGSEDHLVYNYKLNGGTRLYDTGPYANHIEIRNGEIPWVHESIALKDIQDSEQKKRDEALGDMQDSLITTFESGQVNTSDSLTQYVNQIKTDLDGKIQESQTTFNTLNSDGFSVGLGDVRALSEANQDSIDKLEAVFNMNPSTQILTIGAPSSQYRLELSPEKMVFKDGTADVAEISNQQLKINKGIFVQSLQVGEHAFTQYADGMTTIAWTGK